MAYAHRSTEDCVLWEEIPKEAFAPFGKNAYTVKQQLGSLNQACKATEKMDLLTLIDSEIKKEEYKGLSLEQAITRFWKSHSEAILAENRKQLTERKQKAKAKGKSKRPMRRARLRTPDTTPEVSSIDDIPMPALTSSTLMIFDQ
jgi:hypothetical protein